MHNVLGHIMSDKPQTEKNINGFVWRTINYYKYLIKKRLYIDIYI